MAACLEKIVLRRANCCGHWQAKEVHGGKESETKCFEEEEWS
jgi:hypothetical protein